MGAYQGLRKLTVIIGVVELRKVVSFLASVDKALKNFKRNLMKPFQSYILKFNLLLPAICKLPVKSHVKTDYSKIIFTRDGQNDLLVFPFQIYLQVVCFACSFTTIAIVDI